MSRVLVLGVAAIVCALGIYEAVFGDLDRSMSMITLGLVLGLHGERP